MDRIRLWRRLLVFMLSALLPASLLQAQGSEADRERISSEISRLRELAASNESGGEKFIERISQRIRGVEEALAAERPHRALRLLGRVYIRMSAEIALSRRAELEKGGQQALEKEVRRWNQQFEELQSRQEKDGPPNQSALGRALAQAAARRAQPYQQSGLQFVGSADYLGGIYYLGVARDSLGFSAFCRQFEAGSPLPKIDLAELQAAQQRLEAATLKAYRQPGAEIEQHSQFIALNSTLKEVRELLSEGALFGALDKALEARLRLSMIEAEAQAPPERAGLAESSARRKSSLSAGLDHSIGLSYWEAAQELLDKPQPKAEDLKRAGAILDQLLPLYFRLIQEHSP